MLVDSHCHLNYDVFDEDREQIYIRAKEAGIGCMLSICARLQDMEAIYKIAESRPNIYASIGIHPHDADTMPDTLQEQLLHWANKPKVIGIGETGLDYYYEYSDREKQKENFLHHIAISRKTRLPLIIHTRDADHDTMQILEDEVKKGFFPFLIHCFTASQELADLCLHLGGYISISGIVTFKKAEQLQQIVKTLPLDKILVETDSPYLAPMPHRGKRNEPSFTRFVAEKVAQLQNIPLKTLEEATTNNFFTLFNQADRTIIKEFNNLNE